MYNTQLTTFDTDVSDERHDRACTPLCTHYYKLVFLSPIVIIEMHKLI